MLSPTTEDLQYMRDDYPHIQVPGSKIDKAPTLERCHGISLLRALEEAGPESQQQQESTTSQLGCQQRIKSACVVTDNIETLLGYHLFRCQHIRQAGVNSNMRSLPRFVLYTILSPRLQMPLRCFDAIHGQSLDAIKCPQDQLLSSSQVLSCPSYLDTPVMLLIAILDVLNPALHPQCYLSRLFTLLQTAVEQPPMP